VEKKDLSPFQNVQIGTGAPAPSCSVDTGPCPGISRPNPHLHLVLTLKTIGAVPLLPLYTFFAWTG